MYISLIYWCYNITFICLIENIVCILTSTTPNYLVYLSVVPVLIPNTPYSDSPKASYVELAMTGLLLGDGVLVKKYKGGGTYLKFAQGEVHLDYLNHVFSLFKDLGIVLMESPTKGHSTLKGVVYTWYQFSTQSISSWNPLICSLVCEWG